MTSECSFIQVHAAEKEFFENGHCKLGRFNSAELKSLRDFAIKNINFGGLFLSQSEFDAQYDHVSVNTIPGRNLAEKADTLPIFSNKSFVSQISKIVGIKWRVLDYKYVVALPQDIVPDWIDEQNNGRPIKNIGAYIKPQYRNCTYFRGIDFHQDIIDFPGRNPDFVTIYIYLDNVDIRESPLIVLDGSHMLGASTFPHQLKYCNVKNCISHSQGANQPAKDFNHSALLGSTGDVFCWHPFLIHGTYASPAGSIRISLRILIEKNSDETKECWLDNLTNSIQQPHRLSQTRTDLTSKGQSEVSINLLEKIRDLYI